MKLTISAILLWLPTFLYAQINSFPASEGFESAFTTGSNVVFISSWTGNEVSTSNRIFKGSDARTGTGSLNIIPTSSFSGEVLISFDFTGINNPKIQFYAYSKQNGTVTSDRPVLLNFSTSVNGGSSYLDNVQIGDNSTFPNSDATSYTQYEYQLPSSASNSNNVVVRLTAARGSGTGSSAELVMDDFSIDASILPIGISTTSATSATSIQIVFNQDVEQSSAEIASNYSINEGITVSSASRTSSNTVILTTSNLANNTYNININGVNNADLNSTASNLATSVTTNLATSKRAIVINEIFADPSGGSQPNPLVLPNNTDDEYIELFNTSSQAIDINNFDLGGGTVGDFTLAANSYVILTSTSNVTDFQSFGNVIGVSSWNTLSNGGEQVILRDQLGNIVDSLTFNTDWYKDSNKSDGGWSLEQINPNQTCSDIDNWSSSTSTNGGTPGTQNSIFDNTPDTSGPNLLSVSVSSPTQLIVTFNELMDESSLNSGSYQLNNGASVSGVASVSPGLRSLTINLSQAMVSGTIYTMTITGVTDCSGNAISTNSVDFLFDNEAPSLSRYVLKDNQTIDLIFDEQLNESIAETEANFSLSSSIGNPSNSTLSESDKTRLRLTFAGPLNLSTAYTLTYQNLADTLGNTISTSNQVFTFENQIDTLIVITDQLLDVIFTEDVNNTSEVVTNYTVDQSIGNPSSANIDGSNSKLVHLAFNSAFPENRDISIEFEGIQSSSNSFLQLLNSNFRYDTDNPDLDSLIVIDENSIQLYFDEVLDRTSAEAINNYSVNNDLGNPAAATLQTSDSSVVLDFASNFTQELENQLTYTEIEDPSGNTISTNRNINFTYDRLAPRLARINVLSPTELEVVFSEEIVQNFAENVNNYSVDNGIGSPISALRSAENTNRVILTFNSLGNNATNTLTISNLTDTFSNSISTTISGTFSSQTPSFGRFTVLSDSTVQIQFTKPLTQASAEEKENYGFDNGIGPLSITQNQSEASIVDIVLTTKMRVGVNYRLAVNGLVDTDGNVVTPITFDFSYDTKIEVINIINANTILVDFSAPLNETEAETLTNFELDNNIGNPNSAVLGSVDSTQITLVFGQALTESNDYALSVSNLVDYYGNVIPYSQNELTFDVSAPSIISVNTNYFNEIEVVFNEPIDGTTARTLNHYALDNGIGQPIEARVTSGFNDRVTLTFASSLSEGINYQLTVDRVEDTNGKAINLATFDFNFTAPYDPSFRELIINEIYFDTDLSSNIPNAEFIEILNRSGQNIELRDFKITDKKDTASLTQFNLSDNGFLTVSSIANESSFGAYGNALGLRSFPSLSNTGETIILLDRNDEIIDSIAYSRDFYNDPDKVEGGYSVELINPNANCYDVSNYGASVNADGGTPGTQNSIFDISPDVIAPEASSFQIISRTQLQVDFNEAMDISTLVNGNFQFTNSISISSLELVGQFGKQVLINLSSPFELGLVHTLTISGVSDCSGNQINQVSFEFSQGAEPTENELIITEIMASPSPSQGLPEVEYLEILNVSGRILSTSGVVLSDAVGSTTLPPINLNPNERALLVPSSAISQFNNLTNVLGVSNWINLNTTGDRLRMHNASNQEVFRVNYTSDWYGDQSKSNGGYSLEMIDTNYPCLEAVNWRASNNSNGGTPMSANSIDGSNPDLSGPNITLAVATNTSTIQVNFDEKLNASAISLSNFSSNNGISFIAVQVDEDERSVLLTTGQDLTPNTVYTITASNITDCTGNLIDPNGNSYEVIVAAEANNQDVVINEILFNPNSGGVRFVEIYNNSSKILNLKDWKLAGLNNSRTLSEENLFMSPGEYLTITNDGTILSNQYSNALSSTYVIVSSMPSLPASGGTAFIRDNSDQEIDAFEFDESLHSPLLADTRGVSLERVAFSGPTNDTNNWISASSAVNFATPGYENSQSGVPSAPAGQINLDPPTFAPDIAGASNFTMLNYEFDDPGNTVTVKIIDTSGKVVRILTQNALVGTSGFFTWDGTLDNGGKARVGYYMVLLEVINPDGDINYIRERVAIGTRF